MCKLDESDERLFIINRKNDILNNKTANNQHKRICKTYMFIAGYIILFFDADVYKILEQIHGPKLYLNYCEWMVYLNTKLTSFPFPALYF